MAYSLMFIALGATTEAEVRETFGALRLGTLDKVDRAEITEGPKAGMVKFFLHYSQFTADTLRAQLDEFEQRKKEGEVEFVLTAGDGDAWRAPAWPAEGVLAALIYETLPRMSQIRELDLGAFKHVVDDGLPLRKAAFGAIESLVERLPEAVGPSLLAPLCAGMRDIAPSGVDNARVLAHAAFSRACSRGLVRRMLQPDPPAALGAVAEALEASMRLTAKSVEGQFDLARSALRTLQALLRAVPEAPHASRRLTQLVQLAESDANLSRLLAGIRGESKV